MSDQLKRRRQRKILDQVSKTIDPWDKATDQISSLKQRAEMAEKEVDRLRQEIADLKEFAYGRAPKIAIEEANKQIKPLKEEIERLRLELGYIANAQRRNFTDAEEFRDWAQNRAHHALGLKPGEPTIRKERA